MIWQFNPYVIPLFISALVLVGLTVLAWPRRDQRVVQLFLWYNLFSLGLTLSYGLELLSADLTSMSLWLGFEYFFHWGTLIWFLFVLVYIGAEHWLTWRRIGTILIVPGIILVLVWTNELHGLIWAVTRIEKVGDLGFFYREYGPAFWFWMAYLYSFGIITGIILVRNYLRWPELYHIQARYLLLALLIVWSSSALTVARLTPIPQLDLTPFGIGLSCIPIAYSLFRYQLLDMIPKAYHQVIKSMDDLVIIADSQMRIIEINPAAEQFLKVSNAELLGQPVTKALESLSGVPELVASTHRQDYEMTQGEGAERRYFHLRVSALSSRNELLGGMVVVLRDISGLKHAEQQNRELAVKQEKLAFLEKFMSYASHDFRTPISIVKTSSYLMKRYSDQALELAAAAPTATSVQELKGVIERIQEKMIVSDASVERLGQIIESLMEIIRLERGFYTFSSADLNSLVEDYVQTCRAEAETKNLTLEFEYDAHLPTLRLDEQEVRRAVNNVLKNALTYTPSEGRVLVKTLRENGAAVVQIQDNGTGIAEKDLPHIFEWFFRADYARSTDTGGVGLGLSIAQHIVQAHQGHIEVKSQVNQGSTFRLILPISLDDA